MIIYQIVVVSSLYLSAICSLVSIWQYNKAFKYMTSSFGDIDELVSFKYTRELHVLSAANMIVLAIGITHNSMEYVVIGLITYVVQGIVSFKYLLLPQESIFTPKKYRMLIRALYVIVGASTVYLYILAI